MVSAGAPKVPTGVMPARTDAMTQTRLGMNSHSNRRVRHQEKSLERLVAESSRAERVALPSYAVRHSASPWHG